MKARLKLILCSAAAGLVLLSPLSCGEPAGPASFRGEVPGADEEDGADASGIKTGVPAEGEISSEREEDSGQAADGNFVAATDPRFMLAAQAGTVKILELSYFPQSGDNLSAAVTGIGGQTLAGMRQRVKDMSTTLARRLGESSMPIKGAFAGSQQLHYQVIESREFLKAPPARYSNPARANFPDHFAINNEVNFCHYVDNLGVRDIWIWMYHKGTEMVPIESNMSMGTEMSALYNFGTFGDVSNSWGEDDLPRCRNTYVVYEFNYDRATAEGLHNYGHQRERVFSWLDNATWNERFVRPYGPDAAVKSCGNVHFPPNAASDYDYASQAAITTTCSDWRLEGTPAVETLNCSAWQCSHEEFMVWWGRRIPGFGNSVWSQSSKMRNLNNLFLDFDQAMRSGGRQMLTSFAGMIAPLNPTPPKISVFDYAQKKWTIQESGTSQATAFDAVFHLPTRHGTLVFTTGRGSHYSLYDIYAETWTAFKVPTNGNWPRNVTSTYNMPGTKQVVFVSDFGQAWSIFDYGGGGWTHREVPTNGNWPPNLTSTYLLPETSLVVFVTNYGREYSIYDYGQRKWTAWMVNVVGAWPQDVRTNVVIPDTRRVLFIH